MIVTDNNYKNTEAGGRKTEKTTFNRGAVVLKIQISIKRLKVSFLLNVTKVWAKPTPSFLQS